MGINANEMIKKAITETIAEELFRDLGFFVLKLGKEFTLSPITQLQKFINENLEQTGLFKIDKGDPNFINPSDYLDTLPDYVICHKDGYINFLEVKFRHNGKIWDKDVKMFGTYPQALLLIINSYISESDTEFLDINPDQFEQYKKSRFNIYFRDFEEDTNKVVVVGTILKDWLLEKFGNLDIGVLSEYEMLITNWIPNPRNIEKIEKL